MSKIYVTINKTNQVSEIIIDIYSHLVTEKMLPRKLRNVAIEALHSDTKMEISCERNKLWI